MERVPKEMKPAAADTADLARCVTEISREPLIGIHGPALFRISEHRILAEWRQVQRLCGGIVSVRAPEGVNSTMTLMAPLSYGLWH